MNAPLSLLVLVYFVSYTAFAACAKLVGSPVALLPTSVATAALAWYVYLRASGAWRLVRLDGPSVAAGAGGAIILLAATSAYAIRGASLALPVLLMSGGVLLMAPVVDRVAPTARATVVLALSLVGVVTGVAGSKITADSTAAIACALAYLVGYAVKLRAIDGGFDWRGRGSRRGDASFFVTETTITLGLALAWGCALCVATGTAPSASPLAVAAGLASQVCGVAGGLILVRTTHGADRATHAALVPVNRCAKVLAGVAAGALLGRWGGLWEAVGTVAVLAALWLGLPSGTTVAPAAQPPSTRPIPVDHPAILALRQSAPTILAVWLAAWCTCCYCVPCSDVSATVPHARRVRA